MENKNLLSCIPIILPAEKASIGCLLDNGKGYLLGLCTEPNYTSKTIKPFHLYLTSKQKIKEGDWCICIQNGLIAERTKTNHVGNICRCVFEEHNDGSVWNKIEATTDTKLQMKNEEICGKLFPAIPVPTIPQSYIEEYVRGYNQKEVDVEKLALSEFPPKIEAKGGWGTEADYNEEKRKIAIRYYNQAIQANADNGFTETNIENFAQKTIKNLTEKFPNTEVHIIILKSIIILWKEYLQSLTKELPQMKEVFLELDIEPVFKPILVDDIGLAYDATESHLIIKTNSANEVIIHQK